MGHLSEFEFLCLLMGRGYPNGEKNPPQLIITKSWIFKQEKLQVRIYC